MVNFSINEKVEGTKTAQANKISTGTDLDR
jgi:hypothetical protein